MEQRADVPSLAKRRPGQVDVGAFCDDRGLQWGLSGAAAGEFHRADRSNQRQRAKIGWLNFTQIVNTVCRPHAYPADRICPTLGSWLMNHAEAPQIISPLGRLPIYQCGPQAVRSAAIFPLGLGL